MSDPVQRTELDEALANVAHWLEKSLGIPAAEVEGWTTIVVVASRAAKVEAAAQEMADTLEADSDDFWWQPQYVALREALEVRS